LMIFIGILLLIIILFLVLLNKLWPANKCFTIKSNKPRISIANINNYNREKQDDISTEMISTNSLFDQNDELVRRYNLPSIDYSQNKYNSPKRYTSLPNLYPKPGFLKTLFDELCDRFSGLTSLNLDAKKNQASKASTIYLENDDDQEPSSSDDSTNRSLFIYPNLSEDSCSVRLADLNTLEPEYMLNDTIIEFYLKFIQHRLMPRETRNNIFVFNTYFFGRLTKMPSYERFGQSVEQRSKIIQTNYQRLKSWTKRVDLFSKEYIVVPINEDYHWYLAIIVKPLAGVTRTTSSTNFPTESPYLVLFDSLQNSSNRRPNFVRECIAEYLYLEFQDKIGDTKFMFDRTSLDLIVPKSTPQQANSVDCGLYLLHFAELFLKNPPMVLSPNISFNEWFPVFEIDYKREEIKEIIVKLAKINSVG